MFPSEGMKQARRGSKLLLAAPPGLWGEPAIRIKERGSITNSLAFAAEVNPRAFPVADVAGLGRMGTRVDCIRVGMERRLTVFDAEGVDAKPCVFDVSH